MKHFFYVLLVIAICVQTSEAQLAKPVYRVSAELDPQNQLIKGEVNITFSAGIQEVKLHAWANGFRSKNTEFARILLENYDNSFYFYDDDQMGGYARLDITCNGEKIKTDVSAEIFSFEVPANGGQENTIHIDYVLKLPEYTYGFGWWGRTFYLENWYPTLAYHDGKQWYTSVNIPDKLLPEGIGQHHIKLRQPDGYITLHEHKDFVDVQLPDFNISVTGKVPDLIVVPLNYAHSFFAQNPSDTIFTVISRDSMTDEKLKKYQHKLDQTRQFWQQHFPFSPRNRFVMTPARKPENHARYYFFHNALWSLLKQHYVIPENSYSVIKTINGFYLEKLKSALNDSRTFNADVAEDLAINYFSDNFVRNMDNNKYPYLFFKHPDSVFFTKCCGKVVGLHLFRQLEDYLGAEAFIKGLDQYLADHFQKEISFDGLIHYLSSREGKDLVPFLQNNLSIRHLSDYYIKKAENNGDSIRLLLVNKGGSNPPLKVRGESGKVKNDVWVTGFTGEKYINFPSFSSGIPLQKLTLDPDRILREKTSEDHVLTLRQKQDNTIFKIKNQFYTKQKQYIFPVLGYSHADNFMAGLLFRKSDPEMFKGWYTQLIPLYSFKGKHLSGDGKIGYTWFRKAGISRIQAELLGKSYHRFYQDSLQFRERFIKIQPSITFQFGEFPDKLISNLRIRSILLWEEEAQFPMGMFSGKKYQPSRIWHIEYNLKKRSYLGDTRFRWMFENQQYKPVFSDQDASYGKMSLILDKTFYYRSNKAVYIRFFGSAFIWNTRGDSPSFDPVFTRGSIALAHQGFNDYLYDEIFVTRQNQDVFTGQVSAVEGGGFKLAPGPAYDIGMSNRRAAAVNIKVDLPFWKIDFLDLFFDTGVFADGNNKNRFLYAGGISLHLKEFLSINYPLILSPDWVNIYGNRLFSFDKLTFSLNVNDLINK